MCLGFSMFDFGVGFSRDASDAIAFAGEFESYVPPILHEETSDGLQALIMRACAQYHELLVENYCSQLLPRLDDFPQFLLEPPDRTLPGFSSKLTALKV